MEIEINACFDVAVKNKHSRERQTSQLTTHLENLLVDNEKVQTMQTLKNLHRCNVWVSTPGHPKDKKHPTSTQLLESSFAIGRY